MTLTTTEDIGTHIDDPDFLPSDFGGRLDVDQSLEVFIKWRHQVEGICQLTVCRHRKTKTTITKGLAEPDRAPQKEKGKDGLAAKEKGKEGLGALL